METKIQLHKRREDYIKLFCDHARELLVRSRGNVVTIKIGKVCSKKYGDQSRPCAHTLKKLIEDALSKLVTRENEVMKKYKQIKFIIDKRLLTEILSIICKK